jgi:VanZ like family
MIGFVDAWSDPTLLGPVLLLAGAVAALAVAIAERRRDRAAASRLPLGIALSCCLAAIVVLTLTPSGGANEKELVPLLHIVRGHPRQYRIDVALNVMANILVFMPFGATLGLLGIRFRTMILVVFGLSTVIEVAQLFVPGRTTSTDDVLLNTLGAALGYAVVRTWRRRFVEVAFGTEPVARATSIRPHP